jgi:hypothetical protein
MVDITNKKDAMSALYSYKGLNFALYRQAIRTKDVPIRTFISDQEPITPTKIEVISAMQTQINIEHIADLIIGRNSIIGISIDRNAVIAKVKTFIESWINLGRFDTIDKFVSFEYMIDHYNKEFIRDFANNIVPVDIIKVKSVVNPNGMYVQQERTLSFKSKKIPFWERSLYKRLEDRVRDTPMDESEDFFYKFTDTGKKIPQTDRAPDILEREGLNFRMNPNY